MGGIVERINASVHTRDDIERERVAAETRIQQIAHENASRLRSNVAECDLAASKLPQSLEVFRQIDELLSVIIERSDEVCEAQNLRKKLSSIETNLALLTNAEKALLIASDFDKNLTALDQLARQINDEKAVDRLCELLTNGALLMNQWYDRYTDRAIENLFGMWRFSRVHKLEQEIGAKVKTTMEALVHALLTDKQSEPLHSLLEAAQRVNFLREDLRETIAASVFNQLAEDGLAEMGDDCSLMLPVRSVVEIADSCLNADTKRMIVGRLASKYVEDNMKDVRSLDALNSAALREIVAPLCSAAATEYSDLYIHKIEWSGSEPFVQVKDKYVDLIVLESFKRRVLTELKFSSMRPFAEVLQGDNDTLVSRIQAFGVATDTSVEQALQKLDEHLDLYAARLRPTHLAEIPSLLRQNVLDIWRAGASEMDQQTALFSLLELTRYLIKCSSHWTRRVVDKLRLENAEAVSVAIYKEFYAELRGMLIERIDLAIQPLTVEASRLTSLAMDIFQFLFSESSELLQLESKLLLVVLQRVTYKFREAGVRDAADVYSVLKLVDNLFTEEDDDHEDVLGLGSNSALCASILAEYHELYRQVLLADASCAAQFKNLIYAPQDE